MLKILLIGIKDLRLTFRDRAALLMMLAAPFALTLGLAAVTGSLTSSGSGLSQIPIIIVNQDEGQLGQEMVDLFRSPDLAELVLPQLADDPAEARGQVEDDQVAAAVIIPAGFTESIIPSNEAEPPDAEPVTVQVYANPGMPTSAGVVQAIVSAFIGQVEAARAAGYVAVAQMLEGGLIEPDQAAAVGRSVGERLTGSESPSSITLRRVSSGEEPVEFNLLSILAPAMALMFLMFTTANGGRTLLTERREGTLPRLLITPTTNVQVLGGKVLGIYLTGVAQMLILIGATALLFGVRWGSLPGVVALILSAVAGAVGWGMLITALAKTPGQVSGVGSAMMLIFGILGGTFTNPETAPEWFSFLGKISPNAWGIEGFAILATGGDVTNLIRPVAALLIMGALLFAVSALLMRRRGFVQP